MTKPSTELAAPEASALADDELFTEGRIHRPFPVNPHDG